MNNELIDEGDLRLSMLGTKEAVVLILSDAVVSMAMNVTFAETMVLKIVMDVANCRVGPFSNLTRLVN